jgi:sugar lactone lactonase YvrE
VLVAEAGIGAGDTGPCGLGEATLCFGATGSVFQYNLHNGAGRRIITGLPSEATTDGSTVLGLAALSRTGHHLNGVFNLLGTPDTRAAEGPAAGPLGTVARLHRSGKVSPFGDIANYEIQQYGANEESDPYDLIQVHGGTVVANAGGHAVFGNVGGNDLLFVNRHGQVSTIAAFPQRIPAENPKDIVESVPTAVVQGPDGAFYVGELTGFPYYVGEARVWRVVPGHAPTIFAQGFTNIISMAVDHHGRLIVAEIAEHSLLNADQTGALIRINHDGSQRVLASTGLTNPGGVAVGANDHTFYVTNFTQGNGGTGQLLKVIVHG